MAAAGTDGGARPEIPADAPRVFVHVDMDAFFAAIEQRDHPEWRGKPVVVGAPPDQRGVVSTASYEAREYGIHSAMPSSEAGRRCPHAIFVPPDMVRYEQVSAQVFGIFNRYTPYVEGLSIDEAFLEVAGSRRFYGDGREIAERIRADIRRETGLTCSAGVAPNKFLAKLGSEYRKPDGLTVLPFGRAEIAAFLRPLPVTRVWGVGKVMRMALDRAALHTIGDLQDAPEALLRHVAGPHGAAHLRALAYGDDPREIELDVREKTISREYTFLRDETSRAVLEDTLLDLVDDVAARLRTDGRLASLGRLKLRWQGFETLTRQRPFYRPTNLEEDLRAMAHDLFRSVDLSHPVRLIGFGVGDLGSDAPRPRQLDLFDPATGAPAAPSSATEARRGKQARLARTADGIRERFGRKSLRRARTLPPPPPRAARSPGNRPSPPEKT
ncbi:MAG: DNA polymerase IV [Kiritimatiellae bacterium]|nr:DNA polymerase IV [Kiritimatiellia bacterium]